MDIITPFFYNYLPQAAWVLFASAERLGFPVHLYGVNMPCPWSGIGKTVDLARFLRAHTELLNRVVLFVDAVDTIMLRDQAAWDALEADVRKNGVLSSGMMVCNPPAEWAYQAHPQTSYSSTRKMDGLRDGVQGRDLLALYDRVPEHPYPYVNSGLVCGLGSELLTFVEDVDKTLHTREIPLRRERVPADEWRIHCHRLHKPESLRVDTKHRFLSSQAASAGSGSGTCIPNTWRRTGELEVEVVPFNTKPVALHLPDCDTRNSGTGPAKIISVAYHLGLKCVAPADAQPYPTHRPDGSVVVHTGGSFRSTENGISVEGNSDAREEERPLEEGPEGIEDHDQRDEVQGL